MARSFSRICSPAKPGRSGHCWHWLRGSHTRKLWPSSPIPWKDQYNYFEEQTPWKPHLCPLYVRTQKPVLTSHILIVLSLLLLTWRQLYSFQFSVFRILPHNRPWVGKQRWRHYGRAHAEFSGTRSCWSPTASPTCPRYSSPAFYPPCPNKHPEKVKYIETGSFIWSSLETLFKDN